MRAQVHKGFGVIKLRALSDTADVGLRPAGAVSRMAPGETRQGPIGERQSVCTIRRVRAAPGKENRPGGRSRQNGS